MRSPRRWSLLTTCVLLLATAFTSHAAAQTDCSVVICIPKRTLYVVGDSLTVGAESFGRLGDQLNAKQLWSAVRVDALIGRKIPRGAALVAAQMKRNPRTGGFIVALGTNDLLSHRTSAYHAANVEALLKAARGKPVLWVNVTYSSKIHADYVQRARNFNAELVKLQKKYPNLSIASWYDHFPTTSANWSVRDGIHISPAGYRDRARFISSTARTWWKKVTTPSTTTTIPSSSSSTPTGSSTP